MTEAHRELKEFWAGVYSRAAPTYATLERFEHAGRRLVELAGIQDGAQVLDVATGRGASLFSAAERAGPTGQVVGIDLAEEMVRATDAEIRERGLRAEVRRMDAEQLDFRVASLDYVLCGFALYFFPRVGRAFAEFARVLKPGGTLAVTTPNGQPVERSADSAPSIWEMLPDYLRQSTRARERMAEIPAVWEQVQSADDAAWPARQALGALSWPSREELRAVLQEAGFVDVRFVVEEVDFVIRDEEEWWTAQWSHMPRAQLELLEPELVDRLKAEAFVRLRAVMGPDGIHMHAANMHTLARKPVR